MGKKPNVVRLPYHIFGEHMIRYEEDDEDVEQLMESVKNTQFTEWMAMNKMELEASQQLQLLLQNPAGNEEEIKKLQKLDKPGEPWGYELTYDDYPKYYTWNTTKKKKWSRRVRKVISYSSSKTLTLQNFFVEKIVVSRLYKAHPSQGERYYMRLLLLHQTRVTNWNDLRTVNDVVYEKHREACDALGLLKDDEEWRNCLQEAADSQSPMLTYNLFITILTQCLPDNPAALWEQFKYEICERFFRQENVHAWLNASDEEKDECVELGLRQIKTDLAVINQNEEKSNDFYCLPEPEHYEFGGVPKIIVKEQNYVQSRQRQIYEKNYDHMDESNGADSQKQVFENLMEAIDNPPEEGYIAFIDAPGGTGKTFVLNTILAKIRSRGEVALACAFSGVAALLLEGGCTVHKRFDVKPSMPQEQQFTIKRNSALAELMKMAKVIVIDEAPMMDVWIMRSIDATLRDILDENRMFGGLPIILAGDFRQILPVVKHTRSPAKIMEHCLKKGAFWKDVSQFRLIENMRVKLKNGDPNFSKWLIQVGDQECEKVDLDVKTKPEEEYIPLPPEWNMHSEAADLDEFITEMFPDMRRTFHENSRNQEVKMVSILTPKNANMHEINAKCIEKCPGNMITKRSIDSANLDNDDLNEYQIPVEVLNGLPTPSGMAPHELQLKRYCPLVLLKNLNVSQGLCNGTRCILLEVRRYSLRVKLVHNGEEAFIPRIKMIEKEKFGFCLNRVQFPVQLAFAMSINKAQVNLSRHLDIWSSIVCFFEGQTLSRCGLYLPGEVFAHGQLYVALSRVSNYTDLVIFRPQTDVVWMEDDVKYLKNIVYKEILRDDDEAM